MLKKGPPEMIEHKLRSKSPDPQCTGRHTKLQAALWVTLVLRHAGKQGVGWRGSLPAA